MPRIEIKLKQHTPIIHFQHDRDYATIRATELKPKLDKFIANDLEKVNPQIYEKYKDLITEENFSMTHNQNVSSNFKVHVIADSPESKKIKFATYISQNDKENLDKSVDPNMPAPYFGDALAVTHKNISLVIFSFNKRLLELIVESVPYVLAYNNFGTRQSKGFGCFLPVDMSNKQLIYILSKKHAVFYACNNQKNPFAKINNDYQVLKSGKNFGSYEKSKLAIHFINSDIRWEKKKIKQEFANINATLRGARTDNYDRNEENLHYNYIRALLGLAEHNEFQSTQNNHKLVAKIEDAENDKEKKIARFRSPITFKVFINSDKKYSIYLTWDRLPEEIFKRDFVFRLMDKTRTNQNWQENDLQKFFNLRTPDSFDLSLFLEENLTYDWEMINKKEAAND